MGTSNYLKKISIWDGDAARHILSRSLFGFTMADVTFALSMSLGEFVKTLVNAFQSAGNYTVNFNGTHLVSGTYLYSFETENGKIVKKIILVK